MNLSQRHAAYLAEFRRNVRDQIAEDVRRAGYGSLRGFAFHEDEQGVWAEAVVDLHGEVVARWGSDVYTHRVPVILRDRGPLEEVYFGSALFTVAVMEDLDTCGRPGYPEAGGRRGDPGTAHG